MRDIDRRRMIQLSGGVALASIAGCLGSDDDPEDGEKNDTDDENDDNGDDSKNDADDAPKSGDEAPEVDVETPDGKTITVESKDEPTVVLFADITSEKGKSHSKTLADLHEEHDDRIYAITVNSNLDASKEDLKEFHEKHGGDWDHAMGTDDALEKYGIETPVTICVIDENGEVVFRADGDVDRSAVEEAIEAYADH